MRPNSLVWRFFCAAAVVLGAHGHPGRQEAFCSVANEHYSVVCHFDDETVARLALESAEAAWPLAARLYGVAAEPPQPYRIHILPDAESYSLLERQLTGGRFANNLAFTSWKTKESYVAMQPQRAGAPGWPELPILTRRLIAHEAAHLVLYHCRSDFEAHPAWLTEGVAELVSDEAMRSMGWAGAELEDPFSSSRLETLRLSLDEMDTALVDAALRNGGGYALQGAFLSFLARRVGTDAVQSFLESSRGFGLEMESEPWRFQQLFHDRFAPDGTDELEDAFRAELRSCVPLWYEEGRSLELAPDGEGWVQLAFPRWPAVAWRVGENLLGVTSVGAELEIAEGRGDATATILLGGRPWVVTQQSMSARAIELDPAHGVRVRTSRGTYFEVPPPWAAGEDTCLARCPPLGRRFEVRLRIDDQCATVELEGEEVLRVDVSTCDRHGHLGLSVPRGGMVRWRALEIEHAR